MIATDFQSFSIIEDEGFKLVLNVMDQRYKVPSCKYFAEKIIPNMYKDVHEKVKASIQSATFLALTTDCWMFRAVDSYGTAHLRITLKCHTCNTTLPLLGLACPHYVQRGGISFSAWIHNHQWQVKP